MKIGKYISELLFENDSVILPQVGEFSTKYIPAKFIPELKKVESPSKIVVFNDQNKAGGGLLIEYIAKKENITGQEAREFVTNFTTEMINSLKAGKKVDIENIGVFTMEGSGSIKLDPDKNINYLSDSHGMTSVNEPARKTEADAKSELDKVLDDLQKDETPVATRPGAVQPPQAESAKPVSTPVSDHPPVVPVRPIQEPVSQKITPRTQPEAEERRVKNGLPPAVKWLAITVVPLLIIIIILALNFEYIFGDKSVVFKRNTPTPAVTTQPAPPVVEETPVQQAPVAVSEEAFDPTITPAAPERGRPVYYIVVGSFEEEHSATILAEELRGKGARTANVFPANRQGFYRVYYGYYYDLGQAENELAKAKEINPQAWILHR
jgi:hypothetical protein